MADLFVNLKADADVSDLVGAILTFEELGDAVEGLKADVNDLNGKTGRIKIETVAPGVGKIVEVNDALDKNTLARAKNTAEIRKAAGPQEGSVLATRQALAAEKQQLTLLNSLNPAYAAQEQAVKQATRAYDEARGIQEGSITTLKRANDEIRNDIANKKLSRDETFRLSEAIADNNERIREQLGYAKNSKASIQGQIQDYTKLRDSIDKSADPETWNRYNAKVVEGEKVLQRLRPTSEKVFDALNKFQTIRATFESVAIAIQAVNSTINTFVQRQKQVESFQLALENVGLSSQEVARSFAQAENTAKGLGAPLAGVERSYKRMVPSLAAIGVTAEESDKFIANLAARTQILGLNTEESGRLVEAFSQVLAKGKLTGEELNQQISELDGAFRTQLADSIGVSTAELTTLIETGGIGAGQFVDAFNRMQNGVDALQQRVSSGNQTIQQLQNQLTTINTKNIEALGQAFDPLIRVILEATINLAEFFNQLANNKLVRVLVKGLADLIDGFRLLVTAAIDVLGPIIQLALNIAGLVAGILTFEIAGLSVAKILGVLVAILISFKVQLLLSNGAVSTFITYLKNLAIQAGITSASMGGFAGKLATVFRLVKAGEFATLGKQLGSFASKLLPTAGQLNAVANNLGRVLEVGQSVFKTALNGARIVPFAAAILALTGYAIKLGDGFLEQGRKFLVFADNVAQTQNAIAKLVAEINKVKPVEVKFIGLGAIPAGITSILTGVAKFTGISALFNTIGNAWNTYIAKPLSNFKANNAFKGIVDGASRSNVAIGNLASVGNQLTGVLTQNSNLTKIGSEVLFQRVRVTQLQAEREKALANLIRNQANDLEKNNKGSRDRANLLRQQADGLDKAASSNSKLVEKMNSELATRSDLGDAVKNLNDLYEYQAKLSDKIAAGGQLANIQAQTKAYQDLASGVITKEQAQVSADAATLETSSKTIQAYNQEFQTLQKLQDQGQRLNAADKKRYEFLATEIPKQAQAQAQAAAKIKQALVDAYTSGIEKNQQLSDIAGQTANRIFQAFSSISNAGSQVIQTGGALLTEIYNYERTLIDQNTATRIAGLERSGLTGQQLELAKQRVEKQGEARKRQILANEINSKFQLINLETAIERTRIDVATRIRVIEAQTAQLRLRSEAAIARARGETGLAAQLDKAANSYNQIIRAARIEGELQKQVLNLRQQQQLTALKTQATSNNIATNFEIPSANATLNKIGQLATEAQNISNEFGQMSEEAFNTQQNIESVSLDKGQQEAEKMRQHITGVAQQAAQAQASVGQLASAMGTAAKESDRLYNNLSKTLGLGVSNARAFGGPVAAGTEYFVNDGGGREAFLSRTGQLSMLPAGRNMKWIAPSSGMIIPANLVDTVKSRIGDFNAVTPTTVNKSVGSRVSGNLIGRASTSKVSTNSGNTQRIVNNVTIQSQEPVMDASRIMAQVARLKARRRI